MYMPTATRIDSDHYSRPGLGQGAMSLIGETVRDTETDAATKADAGADTTPTFRFVPRELAGKARKLIESYHAIHGYGSLPDLLWHSGARDVIECNRDLTQIFKNASRSRGAKRANDSLLLIATVIFSIEALARDFAGWGKRFPTAKREAEKLLGEAPTTQHVWFMDMYLYPSLGIHRELANELTPWGSEYVVART
jgi:hypothetical protein